MKHLVISTRDDAVAKRFLDYTEVVYADDDQIDFEKIGQVDPFNLPC